MFLIISAQFFQNIQQTIKDTTSSTASKKKSYTSSAALKIQDIFGRH